MYQPKFLEFWVEWKAPSASCWWQICWPSPHRHTSILLHYRLCQTKKCWRPSSKATSYRSPVFARLLSSGPQFGTIWVTTRKIKQFVFPQIKTILTYNLTQDQCGQVLEVNVNKTIWQVKKLVWKSLRTRNLLSTDLGLVVFANVQAH